MDLLPTLVGCQPEEEGKGTLFAFLLAIHSSLIDDSDTFITFTLQRIF